MEKIIDISLSGEYPSNALSNLASHRFTVDGVVAKSMEGFLQSLKYENGKDASRLLLLDGPNAKKAGAGKNWQRDQTLYWKGRPYKRWSLEYQLLVGNAYDCLFANEDYRRALLTSGDARLEHSIGRDDPSETVLTRSEFIVQTCRQRSRLGQLT